MICKLSNSFRFSLALSLLVLGTSLSGVSQGAFPQDGDKSATGLDVSSFVKHEGFFNFYWDNGQGKLWLEVRDFNQPFIYVSSLASGLGSNPVGLDRGQLGSTRLVRFKRVGPRVFLEQMNTKYRASSTNRSERKAIRDSFANSILWSGKLQKTGDDRYVTDITDLIVRDAHNSVRKLSSTGQGSYSFSKDRSFVHLPRTKAFPENCEFEAAVTLTSSKPGTLANRTAATGQAITLRQHHSFVALPGKGFKPRRFDPRCGSFSLSYADYSVPIDQNIEQRLITRHRLTKVDPNAEKSRVVEPIVYYLDPGVPSPVREALLDGARWWNEAFESAGFIDAFQVKVLPEDADPMDVRYNVIQWVHRATRGWSYGQSVVDPRTGEIIKGHVLLGSLRVRQDFLLMEGLTNQQANQKAHGSEGFCSCCQGWGATAGPLARYLDESKSIEVSLARIRQLSAHEVGHTLGFAHNFAASTYMNRASVMDYPAPRTKIVDGKIDLSDAYGVGIGEWDKFTVQYAYSRFLPNQNENEELRKLVSQAMDRGMIYVSDSDARPAGAAHPLGSLWDNGTDPIDSLLHEIQVRKIALAGFSSKLVPEGEALSDLEKTFVPLYLHHRYQVEATAKMLGGVNYSYAVKGENQVPVQPVAIPLQKAALTALMQTLSPKFLTISEDIEKLLVPKPFSSASDRERFESKTSPVFDTETAIEVAANLTLSNILQHQRLGRIHSRNVDDWNTTVIINSLSGFAFQKLGQDFSPSEKRTQRIVQGVLVDRLIRLAAADSAALDVHASANHSVRVLSNTLKMLIDRLGNDDPLYVIHLTGLKAKLDRFLARPGPSIDSRGLAPSPPGSPIGN